MTDTQQKLIALIDRLGSMGDRPEDDHESRQHHRFLVYMALLMSSGGVLWGSLSLWFGFTRPSVIPFGYVLITALNLTYFARTKRFDPVRSIQVLLSLLLPVIFQLSLGGFINSGAVMLWSLLALGGSLTFSDIKLSYKWLLLYVISTILCGVLDEPARATYSTKVSLDSSSWFFVINIASISSIFVLLMLLILRAQRDAQRSLIIANKQMSSFAEELERRVLERTLELKGALGQTAAIVEELVDGLVAFDKEGELRTYNKAFSALMLGDSSREVRQYPPYVEELKRRCLETKETVTVELCLSKDKTLVAHASPIMLTDIEAEEEQSGCVILIRDVSSERKLSQVEEQLAISEKMSALGTLAAGIAHEINNPLTYVMSNLEMIREDLSERVPLSEAKHEELIELSGEATEGLERISKIVQELRSFMRSSERTLSEVKLSGALKSALSLATPELRLNAEVICELSPEASTVFVDERQLVQVLVNLLINAAQAFDQQDIHRNKIWVRVTDAEDQMVQLELEDNASGMPPEVARQAFDPFFTTKTAVGTGLGLAICHKIILGFGGSIELNSELGRGSVFRLLLPRFQPDRHLSATPKNRRVTHRAQLAEVRRVVVIDDEPSVGQVIIRALGEERVLFYTDAREALMALDLTQPQVIICDIMMPVMSGVEVYADLKERGLADRTLMITGGSAREEVADFITQEAPSILYKPFKPSELRERVCAIARLTRSHKAIDLPDSELAAT